MSNTDCLIEILNDKHVDLKIKLIQSDDFVTISTFVQKLQGEVGTMTTLADAATTTSQSAMQFANVVDQASAISNMI